MMLTSMGAWMDLKGQWQPDGKKINLEEWLHITTAGRDQYVKTAYKGYLLPFGHEAQLVVVTKREIHQGVAYLRTVNYISVKQPTRYYFKPSGDSESAKQGREFPFTRVEIKTLISPMLDKPKAGEGSTGDDNCSIHDYRWPIVNGKDVLFHFVAHDWQGRTIEFTAPLLWAASTSVATQAIAGSMIEKYQLSKETVRNRPMFGQKLAFAKSDNPGDTSFETDNLTFSVKSTDVEPYFNPIMAKADIKLVAASQLSGNLSQKFPVILFPKYIESEFLSTVNPSKIFLQRDPELALQDDRGHLNFKGSQSGGVVTPNMQIGGISREFGPTGGGVNKLNEFALDQSGSTPDFFNGFFQGAKILGGLELGSIIEPKFSGGNNLPKLITLTDYDAKNNPVQVNTQYRWAPELKNHSIFNASANNQKARLTLDLQMSAQLNNKAATNQINGRLDNFSFELFDVLSMQFKHFSFSSINGQKPDFSVEFSEIKFKGILSFLERLKSVIKLDGFSDPPGLDVTQAGVRLDYSLSVPAVQLGAFALQNIQLSAGLNLPFTNDPMRFRFAFGERHNPFALTVSLFSGGGFFGIASGIDGIEMIEASLEFGGNIAIGLGVASGQVVVMGGIYFKWENNAVALTGYVRAVGALQVLGLITVSMEFYMGLTYDFDTEKVVGRASVRVEIELVFVSKSVTVTMERKFSGSNGDPTFKQVMSEDPRLLIENKRWDNQHANYWETYCDAFATFEEESTNPIQPSSKPVNAADEYWYQTW